MELERGSRTQPLASHNQAASADVETSCAREVRINGILSHEDGAAEAASIVGEFRHLMELGMPLAFSKSAKMIQDVSTCMLIGRSGTLALAGVSQANLWIGNFDTMFFAGLGQLAMLCGHAYGARNMRLMGSWLQMFLVLATLGYFPVTGFRFLTGPILKLTGVHDDIADTAATFALWSQLNFLFDMWYFAVKEYYAAQEVVKTDAVVDAVFIVFNIVFIKLFVFDWDLGVEGAAIATGLTRGLRCVVYVAVCWWMGFHKESWGGWSCADITNKARWRIMLDKTIPAALGGCLEVVGWWVCSLFAGRMGAADAASIELSLQLAIGAFMFADAMGEATGIRMSHFLGAGNASGARMVSWIGIFSCTAINVFIGALYVACTDALAKLASHDSEVHSLMDEMKWAVGIFITVLGAFCAVAAVLVKQGRAVVLAVCVPVFTLLIGLPCCFFLGEQTGVVGIWQGLNIGYFLALAAMFVFFLRSDWRLLSDEARANAEVTNDESLTAGLREEEQAAAVQSAAEEALRAAKREATPRGIFFGSFDGICINDTMTLVGLATPCVGRYSRADFDIADNKILLRASSGFLPGLQERLPPAVKAALQAHGADGCDFFFVAQDIVGLARDRFPCVLNVLHHAWAYPDAAPGPEGEGSWHGDDDDWQLGVFTFKENGWRAKGSGVRPAPLSTDSIPRGAAFQTVSPTSIKIHPSEGGGICCSPDCGRIEVAAAAPLCWFWSVAVLPAREGCEARACVALHWLFAEAGRVPGLDNALDVSTNVPELLANLDGVLEPAQRPALHALRHALGAGGPRPPSKPETWPKPSQFRPRRGDTC